MKKIKIFSLDLGGENEKFLVVDGVLKLQADNSSSSYGWVGCLDALNIEYEYSYEEFDEDEESYFKRRQEIIDGSI